MKPLLICVLAYAELMAQSPTEPVWTKEPNSFKGVPFNSSEAATKQTLKLGTCYDFSGERVCPLSFVLARRYANFMFRFYDDHFVEVWAEFANDDYAQIKSIFIEQYGPPARTEVRPVQSGVGAAYENESLRWNGKDVMLSIFEYGDKLMKGKCICTQVLPGRESKAKQ